MLNLVKEDMSANIQDTMSRIVSKSSVLLEKYLALKSENEKLKAENEALIAELGTLTKKLEQSETDNKYLRIARSASPSKEQLEQNRAIIASLVRNLDKCISQLSE